MRYFKQLIFLGIAAVVITGIGFSAAAQEDDGEKPAKGDVKFFKGIPVFPGSVYQPYSDYENNQAAWYRAKGTIKDVEAFYQKELPPCGWKLTKKDSQDLYYAKGDGKDGFRVMVDDNGDSDPATMGLSYFRLSDDEFGEITGSPRAAEKIAPASGADDGRTAKAEDAVNKAGDLLGEGKVDEALALVNKALTLDPNNAAGYVIRSMIYKQQGKADLAAADAKKYTELQMKAAKQGQEEMLKAFQGAANGVKNMNAVDHTVAGGDRTESVLHHGSAILFEQTGEFEKCIAEYNEAIRLQPKEGALYEERAKAYFQIKDYDRARADVKKAQSLGIKVDSYLLSDLEKAAKDRP